MYTKRESFLLLVLGHSNQVYEGTKVHNPRRFILLCIVILLYVYSMRINYCMRYVYGMHESIGKYTEVWQRLSSESLRVALAYCLR